MSTEKSVQLEALLWSGVEARILQSWSVDRRTKWPKAMTIEGKKLKSLQLKCIVGFFCVAMCSEECPLQIQEVSKYPCV